MDKKEKTFGVNSYSIEDWLADCAIEEGIMMTCSLCGISYWSEDGHPDALCLAVKNKTPQDKERLPGDNGFYICSKHQTCYWHEDVCPDCEAEAENDESELTEIRNYTFTGHCKACSWRSRQTEQYQAYKNDEGPSEEAREIMWHSASMLLEQMHEDQSPDCPVNNIIV